MSENAPSHIDLSRLTDIFGDDMDFLNELIQSYLSDAESRVAMLHDAVAAKDGESIQQLAHALKGSSANVGATSIEKLAAELEDVGREGNVESAPDHLSALQTVYSAVETEFRTFLSTAE